MDPPVGVPPFSDLLEQGLNRFRIALLLRAHVSGAMDAAAIQPTSAAPTMDASSDRIRRGLGIRSRISHFSLRRSQWAGYSPYKGF